MGLGVLTSGAAFCMKLISVFKARTPDPNEAFTLGYLCSFHIALGSVHKLDRARDGSSRTPPDHRPSVASARTTSPRSLWKGVRPVIIGPPEICGQIRDALLQQNRRQDPGCVVQDLVLQCPTPAVGFLSYGCRWPCRSPGPMRPPSIERSYPGLPGSS